MVKFINLLYDLEFCLLRNHKNILLHFLLKGLNIAFHIWIFSSFGIHCMNAMRWINFIFLYVNSKFSQHHLLAHPFAPDLQCQLHIILKLAWRGPSVSGLRSVAPVYLSVGGTTPHCLSHHYFTTNLGIWQKFSQTVFLQEYLDYSRPSVVPSMF